MRLDYLEIVDPETLDPVDDLSRGALVAVAAFVGKARLIDNIVLTGTRRGGACPERSRRMPHPPGRAKPGSLRFRSKPKPRRAALARPDGASGPRDFILKRTCFLR